jgi:hypothetical protein
MFSPPNDPGIFYFLPKNLEILIKPGATHTKSSEDEALCLTSSRFG